ncbi:MAG: shikimate dehydrogenase [Planktothrix agardhii LY1]|uniref:shikimate dehydrogenase n=1 Tax=Planktothrix agardhii TaxID=1160 RepID=UPI00242A5DA2|nr:shikimate dehydrogenase [Planktothrix agardhii]MCP9293818.1 shikimate dehydrogenase [Planktothrix agardhii LY1]
MIKGTTKLLGVIGDPIEHSLSPVMHNAAIAYLGVDYVYLPFAVSPQDLKVAMEGFAAIGIQGFNITIPHKQAILPFLSEVTTLAQSVGAVNTVWRTHKGWSGTNTDVVGFLTPLEVYHQHWHDQVAVILGYGGAARAVVAGCAQLGIREIYVVGRDPQKLATFQQSWVTSPLSVAVKTCPWEQLSSLLPQADLLVNTTPVGMYPHVQESPVEASVLDKIKLGAIAYDLIYIPETTQFLTLAGARGALILNGLPMLVIQGAAALELWLQQPVPVEIMRQSLQQYLNIK